MDAIRILLRVPGDATEPLLEAEAVRAYLDILASTAEALEDPAPTPRFSSSAMLTAARTNAMKCLVNVQMHKRVPTMVEAGAVGALCNILTAPSDDDGALESGGYFYAAHLLHMITGLSSESCVWGGGGVHASQTTQRRLS